MKHAYMIMAHNQISLLKLLIRKLDSESNDIIIHLDKKCNISRDELKIIPKKAEIYFATSVSVTWGGYSQIEAELHLMKKARSIGAHVYYHLLTGVDLPLMPIEAINKFYEDHQGEEFINFSGREECDKQFNLRVKYYHYFRDKCGRNKNIYTVLNKIGLMMQKVINRTSSFEKEQFVCGSAYWDITEDLVDDVLAQENRIRELYKYTSCCDEVFLHTIVWNGEYRNRLFVNSLANGYKGNMRWIDMENGSNAGPYIIREEAIKDILASGMFFARKFDSIRYPSAIKRLEDSILEQIN